MMRWQKADQWLLQKCIGGVRGMWRFYTYLKGSAGGFLQLFLGRLQVLNSLRVICVYGDCKKCFIMYRVKVFENWGP